MKVFVCALLCFFSFDLFSGITETTALDSSRKLNFTGRASVIFNRSFSHQLHNIDVHSQGGYFERSTELNNNLLPGFEIAGSAQLNTKKRCHFFIETSYSFTQGSYKYLMGTGSEGSGGTVYNISNKDVVCDINAHMWNLGAGFRWVILKRFIVATQLNFNYAIRVSVNEMGTIESTEYARNRGFVTTTQKNINDTYTETNRAFSFRLSTGYEFPKYHSGVLIFRNFGLGWQLPWWGIGFYKNF